MGKKVKELPKLMDLSTRAPKLKADEVPHWKVWRWARSHPGMPWRRNP